MRETSHPRVGVGVLLTDNRGRVLSIVEDRDATEKQREIREVYTGVMAAPISRMHSSKRKAR